MEHYEKKISFLGENIQTIRKHRGMKQQELADKIGINMQSLSKIERGVNYPTFDTLEKELAKCPEVKGIYSSDANFLLVRFENPDEVYERLLAGGV